MSGSPFHPWVRPGHIGLRDIFFHPIPTGVPDPHAFDSLTDFAKRNPDRFALFTAGLTEHGYPPSDMSEFFDMERARDKSLKDGPSHLLNSKRAGPVLPQDISWNEEWATKSPPSKKTKRVQKKKGLKAAAVIDRAKSTSQDEAEPLQSPIAGNQTTPSALADSAPIKTAVVTADVPHTSPHDPATSAPTVPDVEMADDTLTYTQDPDDDPFAASQANNSTTSVAAPDQGTWGLSTPPPNQAALKAQHTDHGEPASVGSPLSAPPLSPTPASRRSVAPDLQVLASIDVDPEPQQSTREAAQLIDDDGHLCIKGKSSTHFIRISSLLCLLPFT